MTPAGERHPDFEPGNEFSVTHGAYSERRIAQKAGEVHDALLDVAPYLAESKFLPAVLRYLQAASRESLLHGHIAAVSAGRGPGAVPSRTWEQCTAAARLASKLAEDLGLTPLGHARIRSLSAGAEATEATLADLAARGAETSGFRQMKNERGDTLQSRIFWSRRNDSTSVPPVRLPSSWGPGDHLGGHSGGILGRWCLPGRGAGLVPGSPTGRGMNPIAMMAGLVMEDGRRWGDVAEEFQWQTARWFFDADSTPYRWESRPRGGSKTTDVAGLLLVALTTTLPPGSRAYCVAVDRDQGGLVVDAVAGFVARTPALANAVTVSNYRITTRSGSTLDVLAADAASAWGLKPVLVLADEFCLWPNARNARGLWEALTSAMGKVAGAKLLCATTSGDPGHWSHRVYEAALASSAWTVQEVPGPLPWSSETFLAEQRAMLPESIFRRLHLNQWAAPEDRLNNLEDVRTCVTLDGQLDPMPGGPYVLALDLGLTHDRTVAAVMHSERLETGGREVVQRQVLDRMETWQGTSRKPVDLGSVEQWVMTTARAYRARIIVDPWQAKGMVQRLRSFGLQVGEFLFSQQSAGRLAMTLHTTIRDHRLAIPNDPDLIDELVNVRLRETSPNVFRIDHDADRHDDRAVTLAMALVELTSAPPMSRPFLISDKELAYEVTLAMSGQPRREVMAGGTMAGNVALHPEDLDEDNPPGQTKRSPFA